MISDLQATSPALYQQPAIAVRVGPKRKWIVGAGVGAGLAAVGMVAAVLTWHSGSPRSPAAPVAAPTAPVAAPTETHSSDTAGNSLPVSEVVRDVSGAFQDMTGHAPEHIDCPGDLPGQVGASERCPVADNGKHYSANVIITEVNGSRITTQTWIDEEAAAPPPGRP